MTDRLLVLVLLASIAVPANADPYVSAAVVAKDLPPALGATLDAAIASGDDKAVATIIDFARKANPDLAGALDARLAEFNNQVEQRKVQKAKAEREALAAAAAFQRWDGQLEIGASRSTGQTDNLGAYASINAERDGLRWRHKLNARAELQQTNGVTTTERISLSWQPNLKLEERLYGFGLGQFEHDPSLGYSSRYTAGGGLGYGVIDRPKMKLEVEGGPALRYTDAGEANSAALTGRTSLNFRWKVTPTLELTQNSAFYYEPGDSSIAALTAVDTRLFGPLKARLSYNVQYESESAMETVSRATLVYSF